MDHCQDIRRGKTVLGVVCFCISKAVLTLVDIACVSAHFGILLCLLCFTFFNDYLEILTYVTTKSIKRLKWLYNIFKIRNLLYFDIQTDGRQSNTSTSLHDSISAVSNSQETKHSCNSVPSCSFISECSPQLSNAYTHSINTLQSYTEEENRSPALFQSPCSSYEFEEPVPRKLSSLSTHVISSTGTLNIDETDFKDVDLSDEKSDRDYVASKGDSNLKQSSFFWTVSRRKILNSFRKSSFSTPISCREKLANATAKITKILPQRTEDNKKLIHNKSDSPEQSGCCTSLPHFFKAMNQTSSTASYAKF